MNNRNETVDVVIVGGGVVGSALAILIAGAGMRCLVIDRARQDAAPAEPDPRALAITPASRRILEAVGAWRLLPAERIGEFRQMRVWDAGGAGSVEFDSAEACLDTLGYIVEQTVLQEALDRALAMQPGISVMRPAEPADLEWPAADHVILNLDDGRRLKARLVVAADGAASPTRKLAGIHSAGRDYDQHAVACVVQTELPHRHTARQRFLAPGPLAFLPMADPHTCGIVWSTTPEHARQLLDMDQDSFHHSLTEAFESALGGIRDSGMRRAFPLRRAHAERYCRERLVLVGDAAHVVHPLAGMGANLGLLDAASLAEVLQAAQSARRDIGLLQTLRRYERWRRSENAIMLRLLDGLWRIYAGAAGPLPRLRGLGMDLVDACVPLKRAVIRRASGIEGDVPALVRGGI